MNTALVVRLDSAGDVLVTGPAVRAVAAAHDRVVMLVGPRGRAAAALLPGIGEIIEWQAPWVDFDSPDLTAGHVEALVKQLRDLAADRIFIFTSFHQSPLPMALLCQMAGAPWIGAICEDYPGTLLNLRHHVAGGIPEPLRALSLAEAGGCTLPVDDDGGLQVRGVGRMPGAVARLIGDEPFVVYHPGAAVPARMPSAARSADMVRALCSAGYRVVITGAPSESTLTAQVAGAGGGRPRRPHRPGRVGRSLARRTSGGRPQHRTRAPGRRGRHACGVAVRASGTRFTVASVRDLGDRAG